MGGTVGVGVSFTESENFKFFDLKNPKKTGGLDMSEKVYGISGKNKGRVEVVSKDDLLIIEGYTEVQGNSIKAVSHSAASTIPDYDNGHNPEKDGFAAYTVISVQQTLPNNLNHWADCLNTSGDMPYPKVQYDYSNLSVYLLNNTGNGASGIKYRVVLLKVK